MKEFRKRNTYYLLLFCGISIVIFLLFSSVIVGIINALLFFLISSARLYSFDKRKQKTELRKAQLEFFLSFRNGLYDQKGSRQSYEAALHFLKGYQEAISFEDLVEDPTNRKRPNGYQEYFVLRMELEKKDEAHIPDYRPLLEKVEEETTFIERSYQQIKRDYLFSLLLLMAMISGISILRIIIPSFSNRLNSIPIIILLSLFPILSISLTMAILFWKIKNENL